MIYEPITYTSPLLSSLGHHNLPSGIEQRCSLGIWDNQDITATTAKFRARCDEYVDWLITTCGDDALIRAFVTAERKQLRVEHVYGSTSYELNGQWDEYDYIPYLYFRMDFDPSAAVGFKLRFGDGLGMNGSK